MKTYEFDVFLKDVAEVTESDLSSVSIALAELELSGYITCELGRWRRSLS